MLYLCATQTCIAKGSNSAQNLKMYEMTEKTKHKN